MALGPWSVDYGARARQIRDGLNERDSASPADMLAIQLDDRAFFLARWQRLLLDTLSRQPLKENREFQEMRRLVETWEAKASTTSCGYRFVWDFRENAIKQLIEPLTQRGRIYYPDFRFRGVQLEGPVWKLLEQKPLHLLNPRFQSYEALLVSAIQETFKNYRELKIPFEKLTWGKRNLVAIHHPLSLGIPWLGRWLDMPPVELPGDSNMPRVHSPRAGASQRMAVSPGHEAEGYFHMPCGQSGHFLSPFYRAGHEAWVQGKPLPFLPGPTRYQLRLTPAMSPPSTSCLCNWALITSRLHQSFQVFKGSLHSQGASGAQDETVVATGLRGIDGAACGSLDRFRAPAGKNTHGIQISPESDPGPYALAALRQIHPVIDLQAICAGSCHGTQHLNGVPTDME